MAPSGTPPDRRDEHDSESQPLFPLHRETYNLRIAFDAMRNCLTNACEAIIGRRPYEAINSPVDANGEHPVIPWWRRPDTGRVAATAVFNTLTGFVWTFAEQRFTDPVTHQVNDHLVLYLMMAYSFVWHAFLTLVRYFLQKNSFSQDLMRTFVTDAMKQAARFGAIVVPYYIARNDLFRAGNLEDTSSTFFMAVLIGGFIGAAANLAQYGVERLIEKIQYLLARNRGEDILALHIKNILKDFSEPAKSFIQEMLEINNTVSQVMFIVLFLFRECGPVVRFIENHLASGTYSSACIIILFVVINSLAVSSLLAYFNRLIPSKTRVARKELLSLLNPNGNTNV